MPDSQIEDAVLVDAPPEATSETKPVAPPVPLDIPIPTILDVADRLQFSLHIEKLGRIEAQLLNLRMQVTQLETDYANSSRDRDQFGRLLQSKYKITAKDRILTDTGAIIRVEPQKP